MPSRAPTHSEQQGRRPYDSASQQQGKWQAARAVYKSPRWQRLREQVIREQPFCADPYGWHQDDHRLVLSTQVDHKVPLRVSLWLAYTRSNLQGLCGHCHRVKTQEDLGRWPIGGTAP